MRDYRDKNKFTVIVHSKKTQHTGLSGYRAVYRNHLFKKSQKQGVKSNSSQSFIQKKPKMRGYRGIEQFTAINHSNKAKTRGYRGKKQFTPIIYSKKHKMRGYRGKKQFTAINHSKKAKNTGLSG
jgi:hypothetical protein